MKPIYWPDPKPLEDFKTPQGCYRVTSCQVFHVQPYSAGKTKAKARMVLDEQLQLTEMRVVDGANGLFLSYPIDASRKDTEGKSLFYGLTRVLRDHMEAVAVHHYVMVSGNFCLRNDKSLQHLCKDTAGGVTQEGNDEPLCVEDLPRILAAYWRPEDKDTQSDFLEALAKKNGFQ